MIACTVSIHGQTSVSIADHYKPAADKLMAAALADPDGYANLAYLCDHIGKRISGSEPLERAVAWSAELMKKDGLTNVTVQPVMVPKWVRGKESGAIVTPVAKPLHMLGLGMSVGTVPGGVTAEVVVVPDFAALTRLGRGGVAGKIVVFNAPYEGYGKTVMYRVAGASQAAALARWECWCGRLRRWQCRLRIRGRCSMTPSRGRFRRRQSRSKMP